MSDIRNLPMGTILECKTGIYVGEQFEVLGRTESAYKVRSLKDMEISEVEVSDIVQGRFSIIGVKERKAMHTAKLKNGSSAFLHLKREVQSISKVITDSTPQSAIGYAFYRGKIFSTAHDNIIGVSLLATNDDGNFIKIDLDFDTDSQVLYYPDKVAVFDKEDAVKEAIMNAIKCIMGFEFPVSQLYFDFISSDFDSTLNAVYIIDDTQEEGSKILFATAGVGFHDRFCLSEANKMCRGTCLSTNWLEVVNLINSINKAYQQVEEQGMLYIPKSTRQEIESKEKALTQWGIYYTKG